MRIILLVVMCFMSFSVSGMRRMASGVVIAGMHRMCKQPQSPYRVVHYRYHRGLGGIALTDPVWDENLKLWTMQHKGKTYAALKRDDVFYPYEDSTLEESSFIKEELLPLGIIITGLFVMAFFEVREKSKAE